MIIILKELTIWMNCLIRIRRYQPGGNSRNLSLNFSLNTFKASTGNYEGFKSSGKTGCIEIRELKN